MRERNPPQIIRWGIHTVGIISIVIGSFWLAAWFLGFGARWSETVITVKTNMALSQLLAGFSLLLLWSVYPNRNRRWAGILMSMLVLLIGALTLSEHLFHLDLGIDQLLAKDTPRPLGVTNPNRMGPPGAASLTLIGLGLLLLVWRRRRVVPYLGLFVIVITIIPLVGYVYGIRVFYEKAGLTGIAWPTIIALLALGLGLVFSYWEGGPAGMLLSDDPGGNLLRRLLPWALLIPILLGFLIVQGTHHGFYDMAMGMGLFVIALILFFATLLWRSAVGLSRSALEQRESQEALRESERRYRELFETMQEALFLAEVITDEQGHPVDWRYLETNPQTDSYMDLPHEQLIGHTYGQVVPRPDPAWITLVGQVALSREPASLEIFAPTRGRWLQVIAYSPVPGQAAVLFTDITDRKEAEKERERLLSEVQHRAAELSSTLDAIVDGVVIYDAQGNRRYSNAAADSILRPSVEEKSAATLEERSRVAPVTTPDGIPLAIADNPVTRALQKEYIQGMVLVYHRQEGEIWISASAAPILNADGQLLGAVVSFADITSLHRSEEALKKSEAQLRTALENISEGIIIADIGGKLIYWNRVALEMHGYSSIEEASRLLSAFSGTFEIHEMDSTLVPFENWPLSRVFRGEHIRNWELYIKRLDQGWERIWSYGGSLVRDVNGKPLLALITMFDITERRRAEEREHQREQEQIEFYRRTIAAATNEKLILCDPGQIEELAGTPLESWVVSTSKDMRAVRDRLTEEAKFYDMNEVRTGKLLVSAVEAMTNAIKHAGSSRVSLHRVDDALMFVVSDKGRGIPALVLPDVALRQRFSTAGTLGMGYKIMIASADKIYLATGPEGTTVGIRIEIHHEVSPVLGTGIIG